MIIDTHCHIYHSEMENAEEIIKEAAKNEVPAKKKKLTYKEQKEFEQIYPKAGWVEHDPLAILYSQFQAVSSCLIGGGIKASDIAGIGITNQRETIIAWDRVTGKPLYNAIVWQCRRTADKIAALVKDGYGEIIRQKTGLIPDAYFSASKIQWILDNVDGAREKAEAGEQIRPLFL